MQSSFFEHTQRIWPLLSSLWFKPHDPPLVLLPTLPLSLCMVITRMLNRPDHFSSLLKPSTEFQSRWHYNALPWLARPKQSPLLWPLWLPCSQPCSLCFSHTDHLTAPGSPWAFSCLQTHALTVSPSWLFSKICSAPLSLCLNLTISKNFSGHPI